MGRGKKYKSTRVANTVTKLNQAHYYGLIEHLGKMEQIREKRVLSFSATHPAYYGTILQAAR
jgi:hypothetical protein